MKFCEREFQRSRGTSECCVFIPTQLSSGKIFLTFNFLDLLHNLHGNYEDRTLTSGHALGMINPTRLVLLGYGSHGQRAATKPRSALGQSPWDAYSK